MCTGTGADSAGHSETAAQTIATAAAIILQVKEPWRVMCTAMTNVCAPEVVQAAANTALQETAKNRSFRAHVQDAAEAVVMKIEQRSPLTFVNPALGTGLQAVTPEPTALMWKHIKN